MTNQTGASDRLPQGAYPCIEEDEINLLDLLLVLVRHKWLIFWMVFLTGIAAVAISLTMTNVYRSEATITPREEEKGGALSLPSLGGLGSMVAGELGIGGGGSLEKLEVVLESRDLTLKVIRKYALMPVIYETGWLAAIKKKLTREDKQPTIQDGLKKTMDDLLKINVDSTKNIVKIGFEHKDPSTAQKIVTYYLNEASEMLREEVIRDAQENRRFFNEQLNRTSDALLKEKIYAMLAKEIEKETFARAQKYYSFQVLDPPIVPDPDKKVKPRRALICILAVVLAFFMAVFFAFFMEFIRRTKSEDKRRYQELTDGLKPWGRRRPD
jgi:uncharacterized protein involved in exopolysaccharide biosynthesis